MAPRAPVTPFEKLASALGATARAEARDGGTTDVFQIERDPAVIEVSVSHGASPCLVVRAHEEDASPASGYRQNVMARARARLVYPTLSLRPVTSLDRFNTLLALRFEVRTGDPTFDRQVTVEADLSDEVLAQAFGAKEARAALLEILAAGFTVHFEERALRADLPAPTDSHLAAATIGPIADALATLVVHVPRVNPSSFTKRAQAGRVITGVILVTGLLAAGALAPGTFDDPGVPVRALPRPIVPLPTMLPGLLLGSLAFAPAYLLLRWQIKRRNTSTDLPLVLALLVVLATLGVGLLDAANRLLDEEPLAVHDAKVVTKDTARSRKSGAVNEWLLVVPSWQPGATQLELSVDSDLHRGIRVGDIVRVTLHPGFFGWEWGAIVERGPGAPAAPARPEDDVPGDRPRRTKALPGDDKPAPPP